MNELRRNKEWGRRNRRKGLTGREGKDGRKERDKGIEETEGITKEQNDDNKWSGHH